MYFFLSAHKKCKKAPFFCLKLAAYVWSSDDINVCERWRVHFKLIFAVLVSLYIRLYRISVHRTAQVNWKMVNCDATQIYDNIYDSVFRFANGHNADKYLRVFLIGTRFAHEYVFIETCYCNMQTHNKNKTNNRVRQRWRKKLQIYIYIYRSRSVRMLIIIHLINVNCKFIQSHWEIDIALILLIQLLMQVIIYVPFPFGLARCSPIEQTVTIDK